MRRRRVSPSIRVVAVVLSGLACVASRGAIAQYAIYGYGYGNPGGYLGGGTGFGNVGMTVYDQALAKQQMYAESVSRYQLRTAQAVEAYQAANLMRQKAVATALENQRQAEALAAQYDVRTKYPTAQPAPSPAPPIPLDELIDPQGKVRWPDAAPVGGDLAARRQQADAAIQAAYQQFQAQGQASVQGVVEARRALYAYGQPALARLRASDALRGRVNTLLPFLNHLDAALGTLGEASPPAG